MSVSIKPEVLAIVGPTATGKTALAVDIAKAYSGEVVSADSMQIYRGLDIGTAKPSEQERGGIPHHMIDIAEPYERFSVADYVERARRCISGILSRGRLPIIAGGTGLYVKALLEGTDFDQGEYDPEYRERLCARAKSEGIEALYSELSQIDPQSAQRLHINDEKRIIRALEIAKAKGESAQGSIARGWTGEGRLRALIIGLTCNDREELYKRINLRVDKMLCDGLVDEARRLFEMGLPDDATCMQAIGYKEFFPYFRGEISLEDAAANLKQATRRYAKRQLTWFRRQHEAHWIFIDIGENNDGVYKKSQLIMKNYGMI